jgi:hypothetical protein
MTRKFERLLFEGVPEQPEAMWERNDYSHVMMRKTGKPQVLFQHVPNPTALIVGTFTFDHIKQEENYVSNLDNIQPEGNEGMNIK